MTIGQFIAHHRQQAGLNQTQLGEAVGLSQSQISRIELGDSAPSLAMLQRLAGVLSFKLTDAVVLPVERAA